MLLSSKTHLIHLDAGMAADWKGMRLISGFWLLVLLGFLFVYLDLFLFFLSFLSKS